MTAHWAAHAWLPTGPATGVRIDTDGATITRVTTGQPRGDARPLPGMVFPGFANTHSHAFHRALRGRTHGGGGTFWTWRDRMYALADRLDPDSYLRLARAAYAEMALAGITAVGEFHYLHHAPGGTRYADPNAMGNALIQAAADAGIRITLLDTCYLAGGIDEPLSRTQRRFSDGTAAAWADRVAALRPPPTDAGFPPAPAATPTRGAGAPPPPQAAAPDPTKIISPGGPPNSTLPSTADTSEPVAGGLWTTPGVAARATARPGPMVVVGAAIHSVRAVPRDQIPEVAAFDGPLHVHLSEQPAENAACLAAHGCTPTRLLAEAGALGPRTTAVHATHLTPDDTRLLAGSHVCFCPTTEGDLADGHGPARELLDAGARLCLGSDQHAVVDPLAEARALEHGERHRTGRRGRLSPHALVTALTSAGYDSLGHAGGRIEAGAPADLVALRLDTVRTAGSLPEQVVLAASASDVDTVIVGGREVVRGGRHVLGDVGALLAEAIAELWP
ncbi:formimidoylglutamate deiminase [Actinokineospora spheciospongiae]|uniref:formimidoylglutamate deiminase n=1 Tax=Actinokineospora spheciospongiae TaxID=909613 RepID=UPI000D70DCFD|nr:formimidoylglutamate deiminase [Actinokineospora spheciospongiae]PWW64640.1 formiminoglutamate deiminase [Actinokineospora spheciospongiae]